MENGVAERGWNFKSYGALEEAAQLTIRGTLNTIMCNLDGRDTRPTIPLGHGDPSVFPCFRTTPIAEDAVISALRSAEYNCYAPTAGILPARTAIAEYLSRDLPYELSSDDVFLTVGCTQSIEIAVSVLARPGANILLPNPGYRFYEARAACSGVEVRHFNLIPERNWEVDLDGIKSLADENTVAMVLVNPGNPCGNVFTYQHLAKVAETAKKLGILIISDEVYGHLTFGSNPFVPMGVFGSIAPVLTLGSISKRWLVPGWRCGWLVTNDPNGILKETKIVDDIKNCLNVSSDPATFVQILTLPIAAKKYEISSAGNVLIAHEHYSFKCVVRVCLINAKKQGAIPQILKTTREDFFNKTIDILRQTAAICFDKIKEIDGITCPCKPEGSMFLMVKMDVSRLADISDDVDFCCKLAKEESVVILPGSAVGCKNWLRITFAIGPSSLEDGLERLKSFCQMHVKK